MNTRTKYRVRVTNGQVWIGEKDGEYTIWQSLEGIILWKKFFQPPLQEPKRSLESYRHIFLDEIKGPNIETIEPPY